MKQTFQLLILFSVLTSIVACSNKDSLISATNGVTASPAAIEDAPNSNSTKEINIAERKILKEGAIRFETSNANATKEIIAKAVQELNGYISNDNVYKYHDNTENNIAIRIPSDKFDVLIEKISLNVHKLDSKSINVTDITEEFVDIEARLKTKKELENRYKELLRQANKVEEILNIEKEIGILRTEIESIEGRLNYLKDKVSMSTLTVVFYEKTNSSWGLNYKISTAMQNGWENLLLFFVALITIWPFILLALIIFIIIKRLQKKKQVKKLK